MENKYKLLVDYFGKDRFKFEENIKDHAVLGVGGPARLYFVAFTTGELKKIISLCRELKIRYFLFGSGSKIMISDNGFDGLVIKNRTKRIEVVSIKGKATRIGIGVEEAMVEAESGVSIAKFVEFLNHQRLSSDEFINIPGTIGGNLFINKILQIRCESIKVLDQEGDILDIDGMDLSLKKHIILSAVFRIKAKN